jgi:Uma2 family endonuclease
MATRNPKPQPANPPTLADLDALPPGVVGEIIDGVLYTMAKPRAWHQRTSRRLLRINGQERHLIFGRQDGRAAEASGTVA